jgi:hypothetical protein
LGILGAVALVYSKRSEVCMAPSTLGDFLIQLAQIKCLSIMTSKSDTEKAAISTAAPPSTISVVEHQELTQPNVTQIAFWLGGDLLRARIPNPCAIEPGQKDVPLSAVQDYLMEA